MEWISFINHFKQLYQLQFKSLAKQYNLNMVEVHILLFLKNNPSLNTAKDIVNYRGLAKSNVSTSLESLRKRNLLTIEVDDDNRRIQRITLLEEANQIANKLREKQLALFKDLQKDFSKEEIILMEQLVERMYQNMVDLLDTSSKE